MAGSVSRTYTFSDGTTAYGSQVETEIATLANNFNNLDAGTTTWTNVKVTTLTATTVASNISFDTPATHGIVGTTAADSAAAGNVGQYIESVVSATNAPTSGNYGDLTSISLTAGDWDVTAVGDWIRNGGTWSQAEIGISVTTGNSSTGLVGGSNDVALGFANTATVIVELPIAIPSYRISVATTTIVYYKYLAVYSVGTPQLRGRISARRVR